MGSNPILSAQERDAPGISFFVSPAIGFPQAIAKACVGFPQAIAKACVGFPQAIAKVCASWKLYEHSNGFRARNF